MRKSPAIAAGSTAAALTAFVDRLTVETTNVNEKNAYASAGEK